MEGTVHWMVALLSWILVTVLLSGVTGLVGPGTDHRNT